MAFQLEAKRCGQTDQRRKGQTDLRKPGGRKTGGYFGFLIKIEVPPTHTLIGHVADTTYIDVRFFIKIKWLKQTSTLETRFGSRGKNTSQQLKQVSMQMRLDLNLVCSKGLQLTTNQKCKSTNAGRTRGQRGKEEGEYITETRRTLCAEETCTAKPTDLTQ